METVFVYIAHPVFPLSRYFVSPTWKFTLLVDENNKDENN